MAKSTRRLGRGLDSLVSNLRGETVDQPAAPRAESSPQVAQPAPDAHGGVSYVTLPIDELSPNPYQPRNTITTDNVTKLSASIEANGLLQPITARLVSGRYEIIAGERRWHAAKLAGMDAVPVLVREADDKQMIELALIENLQREDLNAIDRAKAYRQFCDEFSMKPADVADRLAEDRTTVINYLRLLELPEHIQRLVEDNALTMGHARCLVGVTDDARRSQLADSVVANELSVRALEEIVRRQKGGSVAPISTPSAPESVTRPHIREMERRFEDALKTKVSIREGRRKGTGRIVIDYFSLDDFDRIAERVGLSDEPRG